MGTNEKLTTDTFFNGQVKVQQKVCGYRFSIDAVLLAALPRPKSGEVIMDIGTGCGIVPMLMAFRRSNIRLYGIEVQGELAKIAEKNVFANKMEGQITIIHEDVRRLDRTQIKKTVDWVTSNPPFHPANSGRINPNAERACARHEIHLNLQELIQSARRFLKTSGKFAVIYPHDRLVDLFFEMRLAGIEPKWMQSIQSYKNDEAKLVLVLGTMRGNPGMKVAPPLIIYEADGRYSSAVESMMAP